MTWNWILPETVLAIHDRQIEEHGGKQGLRDMGLLQSALPRPANTDHYARADACEFAAAYALGLVRNHPFVDGNKRTAYVTSRLFLGMNGVTVHIPGVEAVLAFVAMAGGEIDENRLSELLRAWRTSDKS